MPPDRLIQLKLELKECEKQIQYLQVKRDVLESMVFEVEANSSPGLEIKVTDKNRKKVQCLLKVRRVLELHEKQRAEADKKQTYGVGMRGRRIFDRLSALHQFTDGYSAFRSYMHRFKVEGLLNYDRSIKLWSLPDKPNSI